MLNLIIGSVTPTKARIWVRGKGETPVAFLKCSSADGSTSLNKLFELEERHGYTGVIEVDTVLLQTESKFSQI